MIFGKEVTVIIPAFNEENAVGKVVTEIPTGVDRVIVVNNGSTDQTKKEARNAGAIVLDEPQKGYGQACLTGIAYMFMHFPKTDLIAFIDADYSDYPEQLILIIKELKIRDADLAIGSRALGNKEKGSMTLPQIFGNWLATILIKMLYGVKFTDLGPMRVITREAYEKIGMADKNFGWTVEMQVKAAKFGLKSCEVAVDYKRRIGKSKVSGTIKGVILAGYKILWTIFRYR